MISLIAAMDENRLIGRDRGMPWRLPADLRHFKRLTMGHHVIMGRKTYETLPGPLPGREIIVVTRSSDYLPEHGRAAHTIEEALAMSAEDDERFVAGGAEIYRHTLPLAGRLYLTEIHAAFQGDTWFPDCDLSGWNLVSREDHEPDEKNRWAYSFLLYERREL